jgi:SAM-dependent methyltransferase
MTDTIERFSNRVDNYSKYRPDYPRQILDLLERECGLTSESIIADIGSGTGISSRMFLENGNRVLGVEPNRAMREAAIKDLARFPWFIPVSGTAEQTTLDDDSADIVVAAQAFHWFDPERSRTEFKRILKPGGYVVLVWNERQLDTTPFLAEYEAFLLSYATDYTKVRHENTDAASLKQFFERDPFHAAFENVQVFDLDELKGRMLSSSYMPDENSAVYPAMIEDLKTLFAKHNESGKIKLLYDTNIYYAQV